MLTAALLTLFLDTNSSLRVSLRIYNPEKWSPRVFSHFLQIGQDHPKSILSYTREPYAAGSSADAAYRVTDMEQYVKKREAFEAHLRLSVQAFELDLKILEQEVDRAKAKNRSVAAA